MAPYPDMYMISQSFPREKEADVRSAVRRELLKIQSNLKVRPGARVGVTVGSRGIKNLAVIVRETVDGLKSLGAEPFIFPAMGSHGGGTAEGQAALLRGYGITEQTMGCQVLAAMETARIGESRDGIPVFLDRHASEADHVVALNRVKPHTEFKGEIESGIMKMLLIGMGKHEGARVYHRAFLDHGFDRIVEGVAEVVIRKARVLFALAVVENGYAETALVRSLLPDEIVSTEKELLRRAKELMPRLPFDDIDVLIVDEMGKNISGSGMDTNVIGRFYYAGAKEPAKPRIRRIYVRNLTPESSGNATGIGLADFVRRNVVDRMNVSTTNTNCLTAIAPEKARIPIVCEDDREALDRCFGTIGLRPPDEAAVVRIRNTSRLTELIVSEALFRNIDEFPGLKLKSGPRPLFLERSHGLEELESFAP